MSLAVALYGTERLTEKNISLKEEKISIALGAKGAKMENLNAEQVKRGLECFHLRILNTNLAEKITESEIMAIINALALITSQEQRIKELTEENEKLLTALANYDRQTDVRIAEEYYTAEAYEELREENERLTADKDYWKNRAKESESEYHQAVKRGYNLGAIDYVGSFAERLKAETITIQDHTGKLGSVICVSTIDQIAKEMLEDTNED
jgi:Asp-tRNA(Asn)/Glu-tRNA(Gln) amidotransferase C subunit